MLCCAAYVNGMSIDAQTSAGDAFFMVSAMRLWRQSKRDASKVLQYNSPQKTLLPEVFAR